MTLHAEIIDWASSRPLWQQDALRRLVQGRVSVKDYDEIADLARREHGVDTSIALEPLPLAAGERIAATGGRDAVVLTRIGELAHVNALKPDQYLSIAAEGLTIVQGENGAGKSGYVRVLKQVCRARGGADSVYPNVYTDDAEPASASIEYNVNGQHHKMQWTVGCERPSELREVSIFDARSAAIYVTEEASVAYLPFGMDLFPRLSRVCDAVRHRLEDDLAKLTQELDRWLDFPAETVAYQCLQRLHIGGTRGACERLAVLSDSERNQLEELRLKDRKYRTDDPAARAIVLRQTVQRVTDVALRWKNVASRLAVNEIEALRRAEAALATAREAASLSASQAFRDAPIAGIGAGSWHALWRAARAFAELDALPTQVFPPQVGAPCILCLQAVTEEATRRLHRFEEFVRSHVQRDVDAAADDLEKKRSPIAELRCEDIAASALLDELVTLDSASATVLARSIGELRVRQQQTLASPGGDIPTDDVSDPLPLLRALVTRLKTEANIFEAASLPTERKAVEDALRELEAREKLNVAFDRIDRQIECERKRRALSEAINATSTAPITKYSRELLAKAVTAPLADAFEQQRDSLRLKHIPISVQGIRGEKGTALHGLTLHQSNRSAVGTDSVLSEGEHRSIALAAFLAEVSVQNSESALVLDDPVSSLDHGRRAYVARQLVLISKRRPILVFTHDLVFLWMLQEYADEEKAIYICRAIRRGSQTAGFITDEAPWDGQKVKQRIGVLKTVLTQLEKEAVADPERYESGIRVFYGRLRDTWERAVEEVLLQGAIRRFAPEIKTQSLRKLHRVTPQQLATLEAGMTKSSAWLQGHDHPPELGAIPPAPDEAKADLGQLETWVRDINVLHSG